MSNNNEGTSNTMAFTENHFFLLAVTTRCSMDLFFVTRRLTITATAATVITLSSYTQQEPN